MYLSFQKHASELFHYSYVLFDNRFELNNVQKAIVEMTQPNISPQLEAKLLNCQATSCSVEQSYSMLCKLLANYRHFSPDNIWKSLALYVNKYRLSKSQSFEIHVHNYNFLLQLFLKIMAYFSQFYCNKNLP